MMNKQQFLAAVKLNAAHVPSEELAALSDYYTEMIDEAMDEGLTEEEAVARLGSWEEIREQIHTFRADTPLSAAPFDKAEPDRNAEQNRTDGAAYVKTKKTKLRDRISLPTWAMVLLILTSPVWGTVVLSLLIVLFSVVFSLVVIGGTLVISLFAVVIALGAVGIVGIPAAFVLLVTSGVAPFLLTLGGGLVCAGFAILGWFVCGGFLTLFVASVKYLYRGIAGFFH